MFGRERNDIIKPLEEFAKKVTDLPREKALQTLFYEVFTNQYLDYVLCFFITALK